MDENLFNVLAAQYAKAIEESRAILENDELNSGRAQELYKNYINVVGKAKPIQFFKSNFTSLSKKEFYDLFLEIMVKIFGYSHELLYDIRNFFNSIKLHKTNEIFDAACIEIETTRGKEYIVEAPSSLDTSSVVCLSHEFIHYYSFIHDLYNKEKQYYNEILSIFGEKVAITVLENETSVKDTEKIANKIENTRLESIFWHYYTRPAEIAYIKDLYKKISWVPTCLDPSHPKVKDDLEKTFPWLIDPMADKIFTAYNRLLADSYGIGYLFADNLLDIFMSDQKGINYIKSVFSHDKTLEQILHYFNINCANEQTYQNVNNKIKKINTKLNNF